MSFFAGAEAPIDARRPTWLAVTVVVCFVAAAIYVWRMIPNPDIAWLLLAAERVSGGARYGSDVLEVNPPLIVWIYSVGVLLVRVLPVEPHQALALVTLAAVAVSAAVTRGLLVRITRHWPVILAAAVAFLLFAAGTDFSQREHFAAALTIPWAALAAARIAGVAVPMRLVLSAALLGTLGFILKPYFLLAWLAIEAAVLRHTGVRNLARTETRVAVLIGLAYVAAALVLTPDYFDFMRRVQPVYGAYLQQREDDARLLGAICLALAILALRRRNLAPLPLAFGMGALGFVAAGAVQLKWFGYHFLPAVVFFAAAAAAMRPPAAAPAEPRLRRWLSTIPIAALHVMAAVVLLSFLSRALSIAVQPLDPRNLAEPDFIALREFIRQEAPGGTVLMLSTNIQSGFPVVPMAGAQWGSRLPSLWPLFALYDDRFWTERRFDFRAAEERTGLEKWFSDALHEDLVHFDPDIIFVLKYEPFNWGSGGALRFNYMSYLDAEDRFRSILARYEAVDDIGRYSVLVRRSGRPLP